MTQEYTLERLIELLGEKLQIIKQDKIEGMTFWTAYSSNIENELNIPSRIVKSGKTAREAVFELYLELSKYEI